MVHTLPYVITHFTLQEPTAPLLWYAHALGRCTATHNPVQPKPIPRTPKAMAASPGNKRHVTAVLDATAAAGLTVLRVFAFADGPGGLQQAPGEYNEDWYRALDYVVHAAGERGLRLILVLTNYAPEGGGMKVLRQWSCIRQGLEPVDDSADAFFTDPACQDLYKTSMVKLVDRENSLSHVLYRYGCASTHLTADQPRFCYRYSMHHMGTITYNHIHLGMTPPSWHGRWPMRHAVQAITAVPSCTSGQQLLQSFSKPSTATTW